MPVRRRPHHKTKTGCVNCRRRRVKCDEQKPNCQSCVRRCAECIYHMQDQAGSRPAVTNRDASVLSFPTTPPSQGQARMGEPPAAEDENETPPCSRAGGVSAVTAASFPGRATAESTSTSTFPFGISDLALLHHWTLSTSVSICREPSCADMWQRVFPEVAFEHPFVAHAILSLAALHLAHGNGGGSGGANVAKAAAHHNEALLGFRQAVAHITEANSEALFIWSLLSMIYVFGLLTQRGGDDDMAAAETGRGHGVGACPMTRKELVLGVEWIPMIRGIDAVLHPTHNYLRFGRMQVIMNLGNWDELEPAAAASEGPDGYFSRTRETWKNSSDTDAETYDRALRILRKCCMFIRQFDSMDAATLAPWGYNRAWSGPLMFIHFAPDLYFTLLHQRQPPAMVLFAHFGALLHGITDYWFMEGLGREIVDVVADLLGSYWRPWISWPLDVVGLG